MKTNRGLSPARSALTSATNRRRSPVSEVSEEDLLGCVLGRVDWQFLLPFQKIRSDLVREHPANQCAPLEYECLGEGGRRYLRVPFIGVAGLVAARWED